MFGTPKFRKSIVSLSVVALVFHTVLRILGFDEQRFVQNAGEWIVGYRRVAAVTASEEYNDRLHVGVVKTRTTSVHQRHSPHVAILDLVDWEVDCIKEGALLVRSNETVRSAYRAKMGKCNPPLELVTDCCESPYSSAGTVVNVAFQKCAHSSRAWLYQNSSLQQHARKCLVEMPIVREARGEGTHADVVISCDVCQIVELCRRHNLTITFVGDSMQAQVWQGLIFELQRRHYRTRMVNNWTQNEGFWKTKIQYRETLRVESVSWGPTADNPSVTMKFFQVYILPFQHQEELAEVVNSGDVLILGWGLHWNSDIPQHPFSLPSAYVAAMHGLLSYIHQNSSRTQLLVHRETSAQHFDAVAGDFSRWSRTPNKAQECKPISFDPELSTWRERCVKDAAKMAGYEYTVVDSNMPPLRVRADTDTQETVHHATNLQDRNKNKVSPKCQWTQLFKSVKELLVLPYYNFTAQHYDQHPPEKEADCTHYCPSPPLFLPLWRSLRIAMDRQYLLYDPTANFEISNS